MPVLETLDQARQSYAEHLAGVASPTVWWDVVAITASSLMQAERYEWEIQRRKQRGIIPSGARYLVIPDPDDRRVGSGGATINALRLIGESDPEWWNTRRVLLIHSGGDSRRLPQYSLSGKLFTTLPVETSWGEPSTVFDETLALSTKWAKQISAGVVIGSGDVVLTFDAKELQWDRAGVCGVAMRQPAHKGLHHGVYVTDELGRVYSFLQKPSLEEMRASGALLGEDEIALDVGLLRFSPEVAATLRAIELPSEAPALDLYQHLTMGLTGQWKPRPSDPPQFHQLAEALEGTPFSCSLVNGDFTHVGTTTLFRQLHQNSSKAAVLDTVLSVPGELAPGAMLLECNLSGSVQAARGCMLHGLEHITGPVDAPENIVAHQVPVITTSGKKGVVIRAYGVEDDPKSAIGDSATWFGQPLIPYLHTLDIDPSAVWPGIQGQKRTLWNARLFPIGSADEAWTCARWLMQLPSDFNVSRWASLERLSLEESTRQADIAEIEAARGRRMRSNWCSSAVALAESGSDIRPLLANPPGIGPLAEVGRSLSSRGRMLELDPTAAASRFFQSSLFFAHAGLQKDSEFAKEAAFRMVDRAVSAGIRGTSIGGPICWTSAQVTVSAPARIDLGGGWSDTPPFCLDWGGCVLNIGIELGGVYPIRTTIRRIEEPMVRFRSWDEELTTECRETGDLLRCGTPGDPFSVARTALSMTGLFPRESSLERTLSQMGGGIEVQTEVDLPMGSGLGTSSILAATTIRALAEMLGMPLSNQELSDRTMHLEQLTTTGGGWQDQAGGIFPGAKLLSSGPGLTQRLRVQTLSRTASREAEFQDLLVVYYTGIRRIAKGLLQQVVGRYLARETAAVQVLHSVKTLAMEMAYAMQEGEWDHLGELLDRHWSLNQILDPNTTNAPLNALLAQARPYIRGAKLAGAGGGGFMMLLAKSPEAAAELRKKLDERSLHEGGAVSTWAMAKEGLSVVKSRSLS